MNGQLGLFAPLLPSVVEGIESGNVLASFDLTLHHVVNGQIGLFAPLPPSVQGIDPSKASASYSADLIAMTGKVRKPVSHGGDLWVSVGSAGTATHRITNMYRLVLAADFDGEVTTYTEKTSVWRDEDKYPGDYARNDPNGFYHGMKVQNGGNSYVLCGPEQTIEINGLVELLDTTDDEEYDDTEWEEDEEDETEEELTA